MSAKRPKSPETPPSAPREPADESATAWSPRRRFFVSVVLGWHLWAIASAPAALPPPTSQLSAAIHQFFQPYLFAICQNNGYRFFAPNPGPSHIVEYQYELADGGKGEGHFPDVNEHWPRLLYHRHFMISESVANTCGSLLTRDAPVPMPPPRNLQGNERERALRQYKVSQQEFAEAVQRSNKARPVAQSLLQGVAQDLLQRHGAARVTLYCVEHDIPREEDVRAGIQLNDRSLYSSTKLGSLSASGAWEWAEDFREPAVELLP